MKKKLLFVIPSLRIGGAEKSLVNLLTELDYKKYDVDALLLTPVGELICLLPKEVNVLPIQDNFKIFSQSLLSSALTFLSKGKFNLAFYRICFAILNRIEKNPAICEQKSWKYVKHFYHTISKEYDAAIGYLEKTSTYFVRDKVISKNKIAWIHTDLEMAKLDLKREHQNLLYFNHIVTVSENLVEKLKKVFPDLESKIVSIENIISKRALGNLASEKISLPYSKENFNIVYVGRIAKEKGLFNALDAIDLLIKKGYKINWYLIGWGDQESLLIKKSKDYGIENSVHFLGAMSNPYPYLKNADLFLLTSFYEGKSIAIEEAKLLAKPIVITNFTTAKSQINHLENGLIAEMNPESIANNIELILKDQVVKIKIIKNLEKSAKGNESEIDKLYKIFN
jgi:glycosyltransferase involved in cell wall biosynthesis